MRRLSVSFLCASVVALLAAPVSTAAPIVVCNTGQTAGCAGVVADGGSDPNYVLLAGSPIAGTPQVVIADGFPIPPWVANDSDSKWIGPAGDPDANGPAGTYTYRTTFSLAGLIPSTAALTGLWATDDPGLDILINGVSTGNTSCCLSSLTAFSITSGFVAGVNTLDFVLSNGGGPTGLRVDSINGSAAPVTGPPLPEPTTLVLFGTALLGVTRVRRRRA